VADTVEIWTDGACLGNPGPGGHAAVLRHGAREREVVGGEPDTTNNRMELLAAITALESLKKPSTVKVVSDSEYVIKGITQWIDGWRAKGWKKVKNRDLWERLAAAVAPHAVTWQWVRGHSGDAMNERVDQLAVAEAERQKKLAADPKKKAPPPEPDLFAPPIEAAPAPARPARAGPTHDAGPRASRHQPYSLNTFLIHGPARTEQWDYSHHVVPPISSSSTFRLESHARGAAGFVGYADPKTHGHQRQPIYIYDRLDEPTRAMLEDRLAVAEGGELALCFASGMAAISTALLVCLRAGDEVIAHSMLYGCTFSLLSNWLTRFGVTTRYVDLHDLDALSAALSKKTHVVLFETPVNPTLEVLDIAAIAARVKVENDRRSPRKRKVITIVDNTFSTPFGQRPLSLGADLVVHSLTKNICGFGTEVGGAVVTSKLFESDLLVARKDFGGVLGPKQAWSILVHGLPTLDLRMRRQQETALAVATWLEARPEVERVAYPGLASFPARELARLQMRDPQGGFSPGHMIAFVVRGGAERADRLVDALADEAYSVTLAVSLGQVRTLVERPGSMTHSALPEGARATIPAGMVRLSIGLEDAADIIRDLERALSR
jgi:methionine-gamma-lyase